MSQYAPWISKSKSWLRLRAKVVADAFVSQMQSEAERLRSAKEALESVLSAGLPLGNSRMLLDEANESYKNASVQVRKHVAPKPKPKNKGTPVTPTA